jgi:hypothetical protein
MLYINPFENRLIGDRNDGIVLLQDIQPPVNAGIEFDYSTGNAEYIDQDFNTVIPIIESYNYHTKQIFSDSYLSWEGWHDYNVTLIPYCFITEASEFKGNARIYERGNDYKFIATMNMQRPNRELVSAWISNYIKQHDVNFFYTQGWEFNDTRRLNDLVRETPFRHLTSGLEPRWISYRNLPPRRYSSGLGNIDIWNDVLGKYFSQSTFSFITEPAFWEKGCTITEKYLMALYGYCLPIFCGGYKIAESLKALGFDVFDDIIDHSYQFELNPSLRILNALELNKHLLTSKIDKLSYISRHEYNLGLVTDYLEDIKDKFPIDDLYEHCFSKLSRTLRFRV